jgi:cytochrome c-type biogenesis protein CcmH
MLATINVPMLWIIFAVLTVIAVLSVLWPLARPPRARADGAIDVAYYKAQLAAIERDAADGLVAATDAEGAKAEAARRLLAAADAPAPQAPARAGRRALYAAIAALLFVPALAAGLYAGIGNPGLPDLPLTARQDEVRGETELMAAVARVEASLAQNPQDGRAYEVLAPVYLRLGRFDDGVKAAAESLRINGATPERQSLYGEALIAAANGEVSADAVRAFEAATAQDPAMAMPHFFLGLAAAQSGDKARAREIWEKLLAEAPADAPWAATLRQDLAALSAAPEGAGGSDAPAAAGPAANPELAAKIQSMSGAEQSGAIHGMVDKLAARLAQNGQDVEGWLRLVRAYVVLHEADKARSALSDAKRSLAGDTAATTRIDALARELGIEG